MTTRREFLAGTGALGAVALAGCLGGGDGGAGGDGIGDPVSVSDLPQPAMGDPDAPVTIAVFSDFSCPHCRSYHQSVLPEVERKLVETGRARYEHHDFPLPIDDWSWAAAFAARSVQVGAGDEAFWRFTTRLYEDQGRLSELLIRTFAEDVGADPVQVLADVEARTYEPVVMANRRAGVDMDVPGTPGIYVNGELVPPSYSRILAAVEAAEAL